MSEFIGFRPQALSFLRRLARNNRREWFEAHRDEYEREVLEPIRALVEEMDVRLARLAPEIVGHPRRSVFRIHRDVRFSADKSPYKTHAAVWFFHRDADPRQGRDGGAAGFYFQIMPGRNLVGGGVWMPARAPLGRIRDALLEDHRELERVVTARAFTRRFGGLEEEKMLKRLPRGVAPDAPAARWLRFQSFTAGRELSDDEVVRPDLASLIERDFRAILPLVRWLNGALGFPAAARR
jgi:uncharacterized protein (TIGR02453 family)